MHFFNFDIKKAILIVFLLILPVFLMTLDRSKTEGNLIFRSFFFINSKIQSVYHSFTSSIHQTADTYLNLIHTKKQNRNLIVENKQLKSSLALMKETQKENERLKTILNFKETNKIKFTVAQVVGRDPISEYQLITVNRGRNHGIKKNMIVINEKGVIGYVFRLLDDFSQVILLTDPHAVIPAVIQRSRTHGIVEGSNKNVCKLKYLKRRDDVKIGDIIVTSKLNRLSVEGFPIGTVTDIKKQQYGLTQEITITPFINPSQLEEVFIVDKTSSR